MAGMGQLVSIGVPDREGRGYLALPTTGSGPGVIVLQEWWGLVPHIESVCDRFAEAGFVALAPDLYDGESTVEPDEAGSLMMALGIARTEALLAGAIETLLGLPECSGPKAGVIGFCMGGQLSLYAATLNPSIGACVDFYGVHPNVRPEFGNLRAPVLGIFAEGDHVTPPAAVDALEAQLIEAGKPYEFVRYPGVGHAFFNDSRPAVYNLEAASDAWQRTLNFLRANLSPQA